MPPSSERGPGLKDWALLTISVLFVLAGIILLPVNRDVAIVTQQYAIDLPILVQAVGRYVADPAARAELAERRLR